MATALLLTPSVLPRSPYNPSDLCNHLSAPLAMPLSSSTPATLATASPSEAWLLRSPGHPAEAKPIPFSILLGREQQRDSGTDCHGRKSVFPNPGFISTAKGRHLLTSLPSSSTPQPIHQAPPARPELGYLHSDQQPRSAILLLLLLPTSPGALFHWLLVPFSHAAQARYQQSRRRLSFPGCWCTNPAALQLLGCCRHGCAVLHIAGSSSSPPLIGVSLSGYGCMQKTQPPQLPAFLLQDRSPTAGRPTACVPACSPCLPGCTRVKHLENILQLPL